MNFWGIKRIIIISYCLDYFEQVNHSIQTQNLNHLGIIAGIIDDLELEKIVNSIIPIHPREKISAGQVVKAIK